MDDFEEELDEEYGVSILDIVETLLGGKHGAVQLGNVSFSWDGDELSWDTPVMNWDMEAIGRGLSLHAQENPNMREVIKACGYPFS